MQATQMSGPRPNSTGFVPCGRRSIPVTRDGARKQGEPRYFTGKPCKYGHIADRLVGGGCVKCKSALAAEWYSANAEHARALSKAYRLANLERSKASSLASAKAWYRANTERAKQRFAAMKRAKPEGPRSHYHTRRARKNGVGGKHTAADIRGLFTKQAGKCAFAWCRHVITGGYHIDHILPLAKGGSNDRRNIQLLCVSCNLNKGASHPVDYAQQHGMLL